MFCLGVTLVYLLSYLPSAYADVRFTAPAAGAVIPGGPVTITWVDSGIAPSISDLTTFILVLYSGSNEAPAPLFTFPTTLGGTVATGAVTVTIDVGLGGSTPNAYFLGMTSQKVGGAGQVINYSSRFTLTGMTGGFTQVVKDALLNIAGTAGPPTVNNAAAAAPAAAPGVGGDNFGIPYNQQTGPMKYAPMQPLPPKTITAQNTSPLWPTSSVVIATTFLPIPAIQTTITQAATYAFTSHPNTAAAQSQPTGDMEKFLNRWKD